MFTVKFYRDGYQRITDCQFLTIRNENACLKGVTLHRADSTDDEILWVGTVTDDVRYVDEHRVYEYAIIENAAGKTTEIVRPPPASVPSLAAA